jgi:hypothetical protein
MIPSKYLGTKARSRGSSIKVSEKKECNQAVDTFKTQERHFDRNDEGLIIY